MCSPLEQFEINVVFPITSLLPSWFVITNMAVYMLIIIILVLLLVYVGLSKPTFVPRGWQIIFENFYIFILDMLKNQAGLSAYAFFPFLSMIFFLNTFI